MFADLNGTTYLLFYKMYFSNKFSHQRLGQAFVNCFGLQGRDDLFYEEDSLKAHYMIHKALEEKMSAITKGEMK